MDTMTLPAGQVLYHGTSVLDFDETCESLQGPSWVTTSLAVASRFARRNGSCPRVISYTLVEALELPVILSRQDMQDLADEHNIELSGVDAMRESVADAGLPGWVIPYNYPDGDDILIVDTDILAYQATKEL